MILKSFFITVLIATRINDMSEWFKFYTVILFSYKRCLFLLVEVSFDELMRNCMQHGRQLWSVEKANDVHLNGIF